MSWGHPDGLQTSYFHMPGQKWHFGLALHLKISLEWMSPKITKTTKNGIFYPVYPIWWACMVKIIANYVWNEFWDVPAQKVLIGKKSRFFPWKWPFLNFDLNFRGYVLLVGKWAEGPQTCSKHQIFRFRAENGSSDARYPLNFARSESDQKSLKTQYAPSFCYFYLFNGLVW